MDFEAIIDRECPAPIHWLTNRRYVIGRVKYEVEKRDARIAALEATERELREAVRSLAENAHNINHLWELERNRQQGTGDWLMAEKHVDQSWREVMANPIAETAVREAGQ